MLNNVKIPRLQDWGILIAHTPYRFTARWLFGGSKYLILTQPWRLPETGKSAYASSMINSSSSLVFVEKLAPMR